MSNILNPENGFFTTINKIVDVIWISLLWSIMSLPICWAVMFMMMEASGLNLSDIAIVLIVEMLIKSPFIGPATTAMYYVMVKVIRRDRSYATKQFFHSFKDNFKVGALASVTFVIFGLIMYIDFKYADYMTNQGATYGKVLFVAFCCFSIFAMFMILWTFPLLSRFSVGYKALMKNALLISVKHLLSTLIMAAFWVAYMLLIAYYLPPQYYIAIPLAIPGASMLVRSFVIEPVLKKYMGEAEGTPEETGEDQWYRE